MIGGCGAVGVAGAAALLYRAAPSFWQQYRSEWKRPVLPAPHRPDPSSWPDQGLHAAWLGHSTVLMKVDGFTIITDPVFSERAGIHLGLTTIGVKRLFEPAMEIKDLPPIDLIVLSHAHMDHFDTPSLRRLRHPRTSVITAHRTSDLLRVDRYKEVRELRWDDEAQIGPVRARACEVNHWGARMRTDNYRGYNGYLLDVGRYRILFGGDTAYTTAFRKLKSSRAVDLALMPIGAYNPWVRYHCTPEEAWRMGQDAGVERYLPIHHQTFKLSREPLLEPIERLQQIAGSRSGDIVLTQIGQIASL